MGRKSTSLDGKVCVVTGAASGIGRATALTLARRGCPLVLVDRDEDGLAQTADQAGGVPVLTRAFDVKDRWAHQQLAADVREWGQGPLGLVLNNAGVTISHLLADANPEDVAWVMDINFWGVVHGTQAFLPQLLEQDSGAVVNVSSIFGIIAWPSQGSYNASKFAVRGYTEALRHELHDTGVLVSCVHPGGIATNIVKNARHVVDDAGRTDKAALEKEFSLIARTPPEGAAKVILDGVAAGRPRILIGQDARATDLLQRLAPVRYYEVIRRLTPLVRRAAGRR